MTPVSLKPLGRPTTQDQSQLFISANNHHSTSLSCFTFFHILDQTQTQDIRDLSHLECPPQQDGKIVFDIGSSKHSQVCSSSSVELEAKSVMGDPRSACGHHNLSLYKIEDQEYEKWISSDVRLTRKMMSPPRSDLATKKAFNTITRVCADCNTTSTPLWRTGPNGPKSLCNACGIRQRKARRAMAEAANGFSVSMNSSSTKIRVHNKEKKSGANHFAGFKNKLKATTTTTAAAGTSQQEEQVKNASFLKQVFPMDEVAEAALLLMDLSSGFVYL